MADLNRRSMSPMFFKPLIPSSPPSAPALPSATSSPFSVASSESIVEASKDLEGLCRNEFGFKLSKLRAWVQSQAEEQRSVLLRFCTDVRSTEDPDRRSEIARSFIMDLAAITKLANDRFKRVLVKMQETSLANMQRQNGMLIRNISSVENEIEEVKVALSTAELEKDCVRDEAGRRFEEKKAVLEVKLREEVQACQICVAILETL